VCAAPIIPRTPLMLHGVLIRGDVSATHLGDSKTIANLCTVSDLVEESEEGSDEGEPLTGLGDDNRKPEDTATDDDADNNADEDLSGPNLANNQIAIQQMLNNLHHGIVPDDLSSLTATDHALNLLHNHDMLVSIRNRLNGKIKEIKTDQVLCGRIMAMVGLLNIFLNDQLRYTWRQSSMIVAASGGHGTTRARSIREWALKYIRSGQLPYHGYSRKRWTVLQDEDVAQEIQLELTKAERGGLITATDLVDLVVSPKMQQHFQQIGISKPSISEQTAQRWLVQLGWQYRRHSGGMYIDGHE
jgi:hypothetical protein